MKFLVSAPDSFWVNAGFFACLAAKYFLVSWSFIYVYSVHDLSWTRTVSNCSILFVSLTFGNWVGATYLSFYIGKLSRLIIFRWAYLVILLLILALCTRFAISACVFCLIGVVVGSTISSILRLLRNRHPKAASGSEMSSNGMTWSENSFPSIGDDFTVTGLRYQALGVAFCPLLVILLYNSAYDARFPSIWAVLLYGSVFLGVLYRYLFVKTNGQYSISSTPNDGSCLRYWGTQSALTRNSSEDSKTVEVEKIAPKQTIILPENAVIPSDFIEFNGSVAAAKKAYQAMLQWRADNDIDQLLTRGHKQFDNILKFYPTILHGWSKDNCIVLYELLGAADIVGMNKCGASVDDLLKHFTLMHEALSKCAKPSMRGSGEGIPVENDCVRITSILDFEGISLDKVSLMDVITYIIKSGAIIDSYYPMRVKRICIMNTSFTFQYAWAVVSRALPASVKNKILFLSDCSELNEFIDPSERPVKYGGTGVTSLGESPEHKYLLSLAKEWIENTPVPTPVPQTPTRIPGDSMPGTPVDAEPKKGWWGRLKSIIPGRKSQAPATKAYLGDSLNYHYDKKLGEWVFDTPELGPLLAESDKHSDSESDVDTSSSHSEPIEKNLSEEERAKRLVEENVMIEAIEAAHFAKLHTNTDGQLSLSTSAFTSENGARRRFGQYVEDQSSVSDDEKPEGKKGKSVVSGFMFLYISICSWITTWILSCLSFIIPAFCLTSAARGGLNYTMIDLGIVMSCVGVMLYTSITLFHARFARVIKVSPVRSLRVCMGCLFVCCIMLTFLCNTYTDHYVERFNHNMELMKAYEQSIHHGDSSVLDDEFREDHQIHWNMGNIELLIPDGKRFNSPSGVVVTADAMEHSYVTSLLRFPLALVELPSYSVFGMFLPSLLITMILISAYLGKRSALSIASVSLSESLDSAHIIFNFVDLMASVTGPVLAAMIFNSSYVLVLPYPRDASFVIIFVGCCWPVLIYFSTWLLLVQYRGDFGTLVVDHTESGSTGMNSGINMYKRTSPYLPLHAVQEQGERGVIMYVKSLWTTILSDWQLLFSSM